MSILIGVIAVLIGAVFCLRGIVAMRVVITLWGGFIGFSAGAGVVSAIGGDGFLTTWVGWVVGVFVAVIFALLAYLYYAIAVVLTMASAGFVLGTALMVALGVSWDWVIILVGVVVGILLAVAALALNLPALLLIVISALAGATAIVGGLMLIVGTLSLDQFTRADITATIADRWWWWVVYAVLVVSGLVAQSRAITPGTDARQQW